MIEFERALIQALALDIPYTDRPTPQTGRSAGVLALFSIGNPSDPSLLITRRTESVDRHKGQMAFPGGRIERGDSHPLGQEVAAALRETEEEVGVERSLVRVLGTLPKVWTPTGFLITPVVGVTDYVADTIRLTPQTSEIADAFWIRLSALRDPSIYRLEFMTPARYPVHFYNIGPNPIWGATGAMIKNLLDRLASV